MVERYANLIDTLILFLLPEKELNTDYHFLIQNRLSEIEGDYYTFLHENNLAILNSEGLITQDNAKKIKQVRSMVSGIEKELWTPQSFVNNIKWQSVRNLVKEILNSIEID